VVLVFIAPCDFKLRRAYALTALKCSGFRNALKIHFNHGAAVVFNGGAKEESPNVVFGANYVKTRCAHNKMEKM
jgi:hypothetical protein